VWPWLGLAHTLRGVDRERSLLIYERLYRASDQHPLVGVAYAAALRESDRVDAAALVYAELRADSRVPGVGDLGLAQVGLARDQRADAWAALLQALRARPYDPGVQALVHGWLETWANGDQPQQVLDVLREQPERFAGFGSHAGAAVLAGLLQRLGQPVAARQVLERRVAEAPSPAMRRELRRQLLALGDVAGFVARLQADVPRAVVDDEANQVRGRWLLLLRGPWCDGDPLASVEQAGELLMALRDVGLLVEVELLAAWVEQRWPAERERWHALRDEARAELAFEAALRRLLYHGYQARDTADLATLMERLRELSQRVLGEDVVGEPQLFSAPLIGTMLDPFSGRLAAHLARYNRHFVLGRRAGGTVEGLMMTRLSVIELPPDAVLSLPSRCFEVVGIDRDVRSLAGVLGGDLAGVALLNHFLIDFDAVGDWADGIRDRRRVAREDGLAVLDDPLPEGAGIDPLDAAWRLSILSPVPDDELVTAVLDMIRRHERQHLVDSHHYLPIEANLFRGIGLLFQYGWSAAAIEAEMERRAELAALAVSPHTRLVLAHIVDFVADPPIDSPHHRGFSRLAGELRRELEQLGVEPARALPSRWHEVDPETVRTAARRLLTEVP
jgi:hypothetical protein